MPLLTVDLIKAAAVGEMRGLGFLPAAEGIVDGDQLEGWKLAGVLARDLRIARAVEIARDDVLALRGVEKPQVGLGDLARTCLLYTSRCV